MSFSWALIAEVYPYTAGPPNLPRAVRFEARGAVVRVVSVEQDGSAVVRFESGPYRPGLSATALTQAADLHAFATAYVECPDEFDRSTADVEQVHAAWWRQHGDAIGCEVSDE